MSARKRGNKITCIMNMFETCSMPQNMCLSHLKPVQYNDLLTVVNTERVQASTR